MIWLRDALAIIGAGTVALVFISVLWSPVWGAGYMAGYRARSDRAERDKGTQDHG